jgi:hypothetical protein
LTKSQFSSVFTRAPSAGHVIVAVLDDVENLAVGAVFQSRGVSEVRELEFHVYGGLAFAIAIRAVAHGAIEGPPLLGAG